TGFENSPDAAGLADASRPRKPRSRRGVIARGIPAEKNFCPSHHGHKQSPAFLTPETVIHFVFSWRKITFRT
ncbi:hypothetical protein, partial [Oscillibacter sp.]|uniref:hypothetical protein n=1 Tax=Oscillibacter sp. TaxID=1945593 RepID=UPI0028964130